MHNLTSSEIEKLELGDAQYFGYHWCQSSSEPTLVILIEPANSKPQEFVFGWATNMRVDLNYKNHVGPLLTWGVEIKKEINVWCVHIDIASHGIIEFSCNSISIRTQK